MPNRDPGPINLNHVIATTKRIGGWLLCKSYRGSFSLGDRKGQLGCILDWLGKVYTEHRENFMEIQNRINNSGQLAQTGKPLSEHRLGFMSSLLYNLLLGPRLRQARCPRCKFKGCLMLTTTNVPFPHLSSCLLPPRISALFARAVITQGHKVSV